MLRTIAALALREMSTRFGKTPGGFAWALLQPLASSIILGYGFSLLARTPPIGTSFVLFFATGLLPFNAFKSTSNLVGHAMGFSGPLLVYPGVTWVDAILARFALNMLVSLVVAVITIAGVVGVQELRLIIDWRQVAAATLLCAALGLGVGVLNCYLFQRFDVWGQVWNILTAPLMLVSGVIIPYESLPQPAQAVLWYNPVVHLTGLMREGFYSVHHPGYVSPLYVLCCAMVPLVLGLMLLRRHHRDLLVR